MPDLTIPPTEPAQRIRFIGYGGRVRHWMAGLEGTVVRFTRNGNPVVELSGPRVLSWAGKDTVTVHDTYGCARLIDPDGNLIREATA